MTDEEGGIGMDIVLDLNGLDFQMGDDTKGTNDVLPSSLTTTDGATTATTSTERPMEDEKKAKKGEESQPDGDGNWDDDGTGGMWENAGLFATLPEELIDQIIPLLDVKGFNSLTLSCRALNTVCSVLISIVIIIALALSFLCLFHDDS